MLPADHQAAVRRALALGRAGDPAGLPELVAMLALPSHEVQSLAEWLAAHGLAYRRG